MIKHIVMWRIKETEDKQDVLAKLKEELELLNGQIEGLIKLEVGLNYNSSDTAYDAVLYSEFVDKESLEYYQKHEKHQYVANNFVRPFTTERAVVDYQY